MILLALYIGLGFALTANAWLSGGRAFVGGDGDPQLLIWNLGWVPFGLTHGAHQPFFTNYIDYPATVNVMWNASLFLPALVLWPVTALFGPLVTYNLFSTLVPIASAFVAYFALRRYAGFSGAAVGSLLYGFSPYVIAQMGGHDHIAFAAFPPLALLALDEICVRQRRSKWLIGGLLGAAAAAQLLIGEELLVTTALIGAIGIAVLCILNWPQVHARVRHAASAFLAAAIVGGVLAVYPLASQFLGPGRVSGVLQAKNTYVSDLLSFVVPTSYQYFHTPAAVTLQLGFTGNQSENNAYLGVPLIVLAVAAIAVLRRSRVVVFSAVMAAIVLVLSMGPRLHISGHDTGIHLPWALLGDRGPLQNVLPSRLAVFAFLMIAVIVAVAIDRALTTRRPLTIATTLTATVLALLALIPNVPAIDTTPEQPSFFTSAAARSIPEGQVVFVTPYASGASNNVRAMLWQADAGYRFRMPEGEAFRSGPTLDPPPSQLQTVASEIDAGRAPELTSSLLAALRTELRMLGVGTVIVGPSVHQQDQRALFRALLGTDSTLTEDTYVFTVR